MRALASLAAALLAVACGSPPPPAEGDAGAGCATHAECLGTGESAFDCTRRCVEGRCVSDTAEGTPDGTACGVGEPGVCVARSCVERRCGDGFVDRRATPPEVCDDGDDNDLNACANDCTHVCYLASDCDDGDPCNGTETCEGFAQRCAASAPAEDGTACTVAGTSGTCRAGVCAPP